MIGLYVRTLTTEREANMLKKILKWHWSVEFVLAPLVIVGGMIAVYVSIVRTIGL